MKFSSRFALLIGTVLLLMLAACSSGGDNNDDVADGGEENQAGDSVTLTVWAMGEEAKSLSNVTKGFEESHDNITLNIQEIPWDNARDRLLTAVASGEGPDVIQMGSTWMAEFIEAGALLELSEYQEEYEIINNDDFFDAALGTAGNENGTYGVPWNVDTHVMYYRTDILEEAGFSEPPSNWEELVEVTSTLAERGDNMYGIEINPKTQWQPLMFAWQNGWTYDVEAGAANFEDPKFREAMQMYVDFYINGYAQFTEGVDLAQEFAEGNKPIFTEGPWMISNLRNNYPEIDGLWDVTTIAGNVENASFMGGSHLTVFSHSKNIEESLEFISYMTEPEVQIQWFEEVTALPSRQSAWENEVLVEDEFISVFGEQLENAVSPPVIPEFERVAQTLISNLEHVYRNNVDLETKLNDFQNEVERVLR
jgi:multiple sugar transport system substrate-binding protein